MKRITASFHRPILGYRRKRRQERAHSIKPEMLMRLNLDEVETLRDAGCFAASHLLRSRGSGRSLDEERTVRFSEFASRLPVSMLEGGDGCGLARSRAKAGERSTRGGCRDLVKRIARDLLVTGLALGAAPGLAQTIPTAPATQQMVEFGVTGDVVYDSNVARSDRELAAMRGLTLSDEIFTPSAFINLALPFGRSSLFLGGSAGYDFYVNNHVLDQERISILGGGIGQFGPCHETLSGSFARSQSDLNNIDTLAVTNTENHESVALAATCGRATGLAPTAQVSENWEQNSAPVRQFAQ